MAGALRSTKNVTVHSAFLLGEQAAAFRSAAAPHGEKQPSHPFFNRRAAFCRLTRRFGLTFRPECGGFWGRGCWNPTWHRRRPSRLSTEPDALTSTLVCSGAVAVCLFVRYDWRCASHGRHTSGETHCSALRIGPSDAGPGTVSLVQYPGTSGERRAISGPLRGFRRGRH